MESRRKKIADLIQQEGNVSFSDLRQNFSDVSEMTLRRDLEALDKEGQIVRVHGGAKSVDCVVGLREDSYSSRSVANVDKKNLIVSKALRYIKPNASIFIDSGSTVTLLAKQFPDEGNLILTSGLTCALELSRLEKTCVSMLGGRINGNSLSVNGTQSIKQLMNINFDTAFFGVTGYLRDTGFVTGFEEEGDLKREVIARSRKTILLMDSSKIGRMSAFTFARPEDVDVLITDGCLEEEIVEELREKGVEVV